MSVGKRSTTERKGDGAARKSRSTPTKAASGAAGRARGRKSGRSAPIAVPHAEADAVDTQSPRRIIVVGSAMSDTIAFAEDGLVERAEMKLSPSAFLLLEEGRKYPAEAISSHVGGGGANVAICAARLGWGSALISVVGDDLNGRTILDRLAENGVDAARVRRDPDVATGVSVMIGAGHQSAATLVHRGASEHLRLEDIKDSDFAGASLVYIAPLSSASADCLPALVEHGAWAGAMVAVSPGLRQLRNRSAGLLGALANVDLLILDPKELTLLALILIAKGEVGAPEEGVAISEAVDHHSRMRLLHTAIGEGAQHASFRDLMAAIHRLGPRMIAVTDGRRGAYLSMIERGRSRAVVSSRLLFQAAVQVETMRGASGADDAYGATLACCLAEGAEPEEAMRRAALNAASVVGCVNTTDGQMPREQLDAAIAEAQIEPVVAL